MPAPSDDDTDEYLDDPISLNFEEREIKSEIDQIIDLASSDEESMYTSSYGKRNFVLPVTFFDISRNVRLLSKCKPLSISIVDCKSTYYRHPKNRQCSLDDLNSQFDACRNASLEEEVKSDYECDINNAIIDDTQFDTIETIYKTTEKTETSISSNGINTTQDRLTIDSVDKKKYKEKEWDQIITTIVEQTRNSNDITDSPSSNNKDTPQYRLTIDSGDKRRHKEKTRHRAVGDSYYAKMEKRKEDRKKIALKCKDLRKVDLKRNTGLVGLKITEPIFKQIIDTERTLIKTKINLSEDKCHKDSSAIVIEKPECHLKKAFTGIKCYEENKCNKKCNSDTGTIIIGTKSSGPKDKHKEKTKYDKEKLLAGTKSNILEKATYIKRNESTIGKIMVDSSIDKSKICTNKIVNKAAFSNAPRKVVIPTEKAVTTKKNKAPSTKYNDKSESKNAKEPLIPKSSAIHKSQEKCEDTLYLTDVGVALCNLGTTFLPVEDTVNNVPKTVGHGQKNNNINGTTSVKDIDQFENNQMRCSLKTPYEPEQTTKKALKPQQVKCNKEPSIKSKQTTDQSLKEISNTLQDESESINIIHSKEPNQVVISNDAVVPHQARSSSPVIPCVTITVRTGQSKLSSNTAKNSSQAKKPHPATLTNINNDNSQTKLSTVDPSNIISSQANLSKDSYNLIMKQPGTASKQKLSPKPNISKVAEIDHDVYNRLLEGKHKVTGGSINRLPTEVNMAKDTHLVKQSVSAENSALAGPVNRSISDQTNQNPGKSDSFNRTTYLPFGPTAIIFRKPPRLQPSQNSAPKKGQPIQSVVNNRQYQPMPPAGVAIRTRAPSPYPPQVRSTKQNFIPQPRVSTGSNSRGQEMGLFNWQVRFPQYSYSTGSPCSAHTLNLVPPPPPPHMPSLPKQAPQQNRAPLQVPCLPNVCPPRTPAPTQVPPPQNPHLPREPPLPRVSPPQNPPLPQVPPLPQDPSPQRSPPLPREPPPPRAPPPQTTIKPTSTPEVSKDSIIGSMNGKLIKKINISKPANIAVDKEMMLLELNNAIMSPKIMNDEPIAKPDDLRPKIDSKATDTVKSKFSKPCPLSKKINRVLEVPEKEQPKIGYSPPILPILTYEELMAQKDKYMKEALTDNNQTPFKPNKTDANKINNVQKTKMEHVEKPYKAKKISFEDYRKRAAKDDIDRIHESKIKKSKTVADDYKDQGYDSDSTVKL